MEKLKEWFPTPKTLIERMLEDIKWKNISILEPSAGKGDICDAAKKAMENAKRKDRFEWGNRSDELDIDVIEIEPELQAALKGKGYTLIADDFLQFNT